MDHQLRRLKTPLGAPRGDSLSYNPVRSSPVHLLDAHLLFQRLNDKHIDTYDLIDVLLHTVPTFRAIWLVTPSPTVGVLNSGRLGVNTRQNLSPYTPEFENADASRTSSANCGAISAQIRVLCHLSRYINLHRVSENVPTLNSL